SDCPAGTAYRRGEGPAGTPFLRDNPSGRSRPPKPPKAGGEDEESSED
ncbi:PAC2 family protein, partial [Streptomyces sp. HB-N217]|nr:PAC2 family protein [Streptomyces sp. HB-N217]